MVFRRILNKLNRFFYFGNRTFLDYQNFLREAKNNNFIFLPLKEFVNERSNTPKNIIGLRHDVDCDIDHCIKIARIEHEEGVKATYFMLHTAKYFFDDIKSRQLNKHLIEKLKYIQDDLGHEIGIHSDLMPIELIYKLNPDNYLLEIIELLQESGINIQGIAGHGNLFKHLYKENFLKSNEKVRNKNIYANPHKEFYCNKFGLSYEAYSLDHDLFIGDADFPNNKRWDFSNLNKDFYVFKEDRIIILIHTAHWAYSKLNYYTINFIIITKYFLRYLLEFIKYKRSK